MSARAQEEATRRDVLARLHCTFTPRINRTRNDTYLTNQRTQAVGAASSMAGTPQGGAPRHGVLVSQQATVGSSGVNAVHDRLYRVALLSRQQLQAAVRRAKQVCFFS